VAGKTGEFSNTFQGLLSETTQHHARRKPYIKKIQQLLGGRTLVTFFISFQKHMPLGPMDADILEEVLANSENKNGITLLIDAPGGDGLTAERIIKICRNYGKGSFEVIVPARAKSAATMVCLGADKILMSDASELGPIDPQVPWDLGNGIQWVPAHHIIKTYENLFSKAVALNGGNIEPFLQQLTKFNAVMIENLTAASKLSEDIAVSSLKCAMMKSAEVEVIKGKIAPFTNPDLTMSHGRGIYADKAKECGLNVEVVPAESELWGAIWGLYQRSKYLVESPSCSKLVETEKQSFTAPGGTA
jgi:hypothetical protein